MPMAIADNYPIKVGNQTTNIEFKPNITITYDTQKIEKLVNEIDLKNNSSWTYGDIIIGSSTIIAFFGFGSLVAVRLKKTENIGQKLIALKRVFMLVGAIETIHLLTIIAIVSELFSNILHILYITVIGSTIVFIGFMLYYLFQTVEIERDADTEDKIIADFYRRLSGSP